jgi:hypothetical protein
MNCPGEPVREDEDKQGNHLNQVLQFLDDVKPSLYEIMEVQFV